MKKINEALLIFLYVLAVFSTSVSAKDNPARSNGPAAPVASSAQATGTFIIGTVYNIFHEEYPTDEEYFKQVDKDIALMKECNITYVMVNPMFQWNADTKERQWGRTDYLIKKLEEADLKFVPEMHGQQGSDYFPLWKFKEEGMWDEYNNPRNYIDSRHDIDFANPKIYPLVDEFFKEVIGRYGKSPALGFYNIWNEPHYGSSAPYIVERFRGWLKNKYGTLPALRRSWALEIHSWDEVTPFINENWKSSMQRIDWVTFTSELNSILLGDLTRTLRKYDTAHIITANPVGTPLWFSSNFGGYVLDNWAIADKNDIHGISYYPDIWERANNIIPCPFWIHNLTFNSVRCEAGKKNFILTELFTNTQNGLALNGYLTPDFIKLLAWTAFANDCKGAIYWQWAPFKRGTQSLGRGLCQVNGELAQRGEAVKEIGSVIKQYGETLYNAHLKKTQAAILIDLTGLLKTLEQSTERATNKFMYESNAGLFKALYEGGVNADILRMDRGLDLKTLQAYKIVYLPFQIVMRREVAKVLKEYVKAGGWVVADARTATIDELDFAYKTSPGAGLDELFGAERPDWVAQKAYFQVTMNKTGDGAAYDFEGKYFKEKLVLHENAEVLGTFTNTNEPAVIQNRYGKGRAVLSAVPLGAGYFAKPANPVNKLLLHCAREAGVTPNARFLSPDASFLNLKVHTLDNMFIVYLINDEDRPKSGTLEVTAGNVAVKQAKDILSGKNCSFEQKDGTVSIPLKVGKNEVMVFLVQ